EDSFHLYLRILMGYRAWLCLGGALPAPGALPRDPTVFFLTDRSVRQVRWITHTRPAQSNRNP
ncbi:hypothetical protein NJI34_42540, partial [Pseudomonas sp. S 311-6]|nr:hypothetical protein [Pseudomonas sp. S 311-6]